MKKAPTPLIATERSAVDEFADVARRFCDLVERHPDVGRRKLVTEWQHLLPELYVRGAALPDVKSNQLDAPEVMTDAEWWKLFSGLRDTLRDYDSHWVEDPQHETPANPGESSLSDDIADIYRDLKRGLALWEANGGGKLGGAAWYWREHFRFHWGEHALDALRRIHFIVCGSDDGNQEDV